MFAPARRRGKGGADSGFFLNAEMLVVVAQALLEAGVHTAAGVFTAAKGEGFSAYVAAYRHFCSSAFWHDSLLLTS